MKEVIALFVLSLMLWLAHARQVERGQDPPPGTGSYFTASPYDTTVTERAPL